MIFALDWDGTFTRAPLLFKRFCEYAAKHGWETIIVTGRTEDQPICPPSEVKTVIYCGDHYKADVVRRHGIVVDVWIDDEPGNIEPPRKLTWMEDVP